MIDPAFAGHAFAWIIGECECGGRADGLRRPIERIRFESLNRRNTDDPPYQWTGLSVERRRPQRDRSRGCGPDAGRGRDALTRGFLTQRPQRPRRNTWGGSKGYRDTGIQGYRGTGVKGVKGVKGGRW